MIDKFVLAPYYWTLRIRHALFDKGLRRSVEAPVPTVSVGNITVGGTGKTPHTEMILETLLGEPSFREKGISVLSRGYGRSTRGFQQVMVDGSAAQYGDEPLQIKKKFPHITVAVCKDRVLGAGFLSDPRELRYAWFGELCRDNGFDPSGLLVRDAAFQRRALKPTVSVVLVDFSRPIFYDHLMPLGHLRDLPSRIMDADIIIVSKCPSEINNWDRSRWADSFDLSNFDPETCSGVNPKGKVQRLFFTTLSYCQMEPVFVEGENRYLYAKRLILFTGIANDMPLVRYLSDTFKIVRHFNYPDHHRFTAADMAEIRATALAHPTAVIATTEKDSQRVCDCRRTPEVLKERLFRIPIKVQFLTPHEESVFRTTLFSLLS
ncbi:MAG: tetraacyldisaccharide 4'-kinase [Bacteroidales bacterium]|nr:tetraacyldisaccharide 4'-kinase [Bacteroidales bacterium]